MSGTDLLAAMDSISLDADSGVPPRVMNVTYAANGAPVERTSEVAPEAVAGPKGVPGACCCGQSQFARPGDDTSGLSSNSGAHGGTIRQTR